MACPPREFSPEAVRAASPAAAALYRAFNRSDEPEASLVRQRLTFRPDPGSPTHLSDDDSHYYNTVGSAAKFWAGKPLPAPAKSIEVLRADLEKWGYCLIDEALSREQLATMRGRVVEQAAGERAAGVGLWLNASAKGSNTQFVTTLPNKGDIFVDALEFDPGAVQGAPAMEQLLGEALGGDFLVNSFQAIIAHPHNYPQALHQDRNGTAPLQTPEAPLLVTAMYMLDDVGPANGGTLVIPGSHITVSRAGPGTPVPPLPPAINVACPAGTVMLFDARVLHGTGVNRSAAPRHVLIAGFHRIFMRSQEAWHLTASPEVLARASPRLLQRLGFVAASNIGTAEGHGLGASGRLDDDFGSVLAFRRAIDAGEYRRIGRLAPSDADAVLEADFTFRRTASGRRALDKATKLGLLSAGRGELVSRLAFPGGRPVGRGSGYTKRGTGNTKLESKL